MANESTTTGPRGRHKAKRGTVLGTTADEVGINLDRAGE
jgi:hypothetical protein